MGTFLNHCALKPEQSAAAYYPGLTQCEKRFVVHCWHQMKGEELPICCFCKQPGPLPAQSCLLEHGLFYAYVQVLQYNNQNSIAAPIGGFSMVGHSTGMHLPYINAIETIDMKTGIIRLYAKGGDCFHSDLYATLAKYLREFRIVERNLENLQNGKIKEQYRAEALAEIETQLWYLPKEEKQTIRKPVDENIALARKLTALKGKLNRKKVADQKAKPQTTKTAR